MLLARGIGGDVRRLLGAEPLEDLDQLGGLDHYRHREVLGVLVRLPAAFGGEGAQAGLQAVDIHAGQCA